MKKVVLFSPNGYVGSYVKERLMKEHDLLLYMVTRSTDDTQEGEDYDIMVYTASITSSRQETADIYVQDNVVTAINVIQFCKEHRIKRIIYLSSDEIYGGLNTEIVTDKAVMVEPNLYAATKYLAEKIIVESQIPYFILRLPGIVGRKWGTNFIYRLMDRIKNNERINLYNADKKFNNILDVDDLADFIALLCKCEKKNDEIFLLGSTEEMNLGEIANYIKTKYHSESIISNDETGDKRYFTLDVTKAVEYGYSSRNIKAIIDDLYRIREIIGT